MDVGAGGGAGSRVFKDFGYSVSAFDLTRSGWISLFSEMGTVYEARDLLGEGIFYVGRGSVERGK